MRKHTYSDEYIGLGLGYIDAQERGDIQLTEYYDQKIKEHLEKQGCRCVDRSIMEVEATRLLHLKGDE